MFFNVMSPRWVSCEAGGIHPLYSVRSWFHRRLRRSLCRTCMLTRDRLPLQGCSRSDRKAHAQLLCWPLSLEANVNVGD
ncbi:uncharacterized protein BDR25DRAFT_49938 [Lindgomyces ingoldianus]|uniref:Uncharacterized protein n=1 Tax=Lindgomyces ingoldianus TaxID=673940 RepID=A0ACB6QR37_9PLEO|nr:uncharacterized protein BDR25DRAFT_49938 [Lindgomyces ingoldianus]KAF2469489.1 hypothetical protein BDR25DRAFT_49938 [Lindgomyces ingoldianus]